MTRIVRRLDLAEIAQLIDWAADEGWNPGLHDAEPFQAADPNGFFGAFVDGTMVAGISAVAYDAHYGFIGLYICHPVWRGQGHGRAVWDMGMAYLGDRTIGLDGVQEQQVNYARMGFVPDYETVRMSGTLVAGSTNILRPSLRDVVDLDRACFPSVRNAFLSQWLASRHQVAAVLDNGAVAGYAVGRKCREGQKIGPLFAGSLEVATSLLSAFSGPVQIDVPKHQTAWLNALAARGFVPGFTTRRMYKGQRPKMDLGRVFAITSLELG